MDKGASPDGDRATLASPRAPTGLGHSEGIPSARRYRVDPDFIVRQPSAADFYGFCELSEFHEKRYETYELLKRAGAQLLRITVVDEDYPHPPYPHGYWFEGWRDKLAKPIPFGSANPEDGTISPPLTAKGIEAGTDETRSGSAVGESPAPGTGVRP